MRKSTVSPRTEESLREFLRAEAAGYSSIVVQAGHFLISYDTDENLIVPIIHGEPMNPRLAVFAEEYGHFPVLTWNFAVSLLNELDAVDKRVMVVVNDWQYLKEGVDRQDFYRKNPSIPSQYRQTLENHPSISLFAPPRRKNLFTGEFWSEQTLRNGYDRRFREMASKGLLPPNARIEPDKELTCSLIDVLGRKREIYCAGKRSGCEHEVAEMLAEVGELAKPELFINLIPQVCKEFVAAGTELAHDLFTSGIQTVINVGLPSVGVKSEEELFSHSEIGIHVCNRK